VNDIAIAKGHATEPQNKLGRWKAIHQKFELDYHKQGNYRWREELWIDQWDKIYDAFAGFTPDQFSATDVLIDVGCGSRPCMEWFKHGIKHYSDPLLDQYVEIPRMSQYWNKPNQHRYSNPAEELIESLVGQGDFVLCWNVLDHTYDWRKIVANIVQYAKKGALVIIGTDIGRRESLGHPGIDNPEVMYEMIDESFEIVKEVRPYHHRQVAWLLRKK